MLSGERSTLILFYVCCCCHLLCSSILKLVLHSNTFKRCLFLLVKDQLFSLAQIWPINPIIFQNEAGAKVPELSIPALRPAACLRAARSGYDITS